MSETATEPSRGTSDAASATPIEDLPAEALAALAEEQQLTDNAEQAIEALLLALLLQNAAPSGLLMTPALAPAVLRSIFEPVLEPLLLSIGLIMLRRSTRWGSTNDWQALSSRIIEEATERVADAVGRHIDRTPDPDPYDRSAAGPASAPDWAKRVSHSIVTSVSEGFKRGLANRLGFDYKRWVSREDTKVRDSHRFLHGRTVHRNAKFVTQSGASLDRPGDLTAPIGEWINCRCDLLWLRGRHA